MKKLFHKILVPVNFNRNTAMLLEKAIQIANEFSCDLHLLHVQSPAPLVPLLQNGLKPKKTPAHNGNEAESKLLHLKNEFSNQLHDGLLIQVSLESGNWQTVIKNTIITRHIDLVLIPKNRKKFIGALIQSININKLSQQTRCPVLTITSKFNLHHLQNIVVPVGEHVPIRKLTLATYLARQNNGYVHLMSSSGKAGVEFKKRKWCMTKAYQLLRDYTNVKVHCNMDTYPNNTIKTLDYANNIQADLIVVNAGKESQPSGWLNRLLGRYLYKESNIPVLTVAPQN